MGRIGFGTKPGPWPLAKLGGGGGEGVQALGLRVLGLRVLGP